MTYQDFKKTPRYCYSPVTVAECGGPCEQGPERCDCGELQPEPESLSPAAQAVLNAAVLPCTIRQGIAAALRAAADQVVPDNGSKNPYEDDEWERACSEKRSEFLAIAAELDPPSEETQ